MSIISNVSAFLNESVTVKSNKYLNFGIESVSTGKRWQWGVALAVSVAFNVAAQIIAQKAILESLDDLDFATLDDLDEESSAEDQRLDEETEKYEERLIIELFSRFSEIIDGSEWVISDIAFDAKRKITDEIDSSDASDDAKLDARLALDFAKAKAEAEVLRARAAYIESEKRTIQDIFNSIDAQESHS